MTTLPLKTAFANQGAMDVPPGEYCIGDAENAYLSGEYEIELFTNYEDVLYEVDENIQSQLIYDVGKVLYRSDTDDIHNLIQLFIKYTHDPCKDEDLDLSVKEEKRIMVGSRFTKRRVLFLHDGKVFVAFGKYMFGYKNYGRESIKRKQPVDDVGNDADNTDLVKSSSDDGEVENDVDPEKDDILDVNHIILMAPADTERRRPRDDCYYSFLIYDKETSILDAFGLYC